MVPPPGVVLMAETRSATEHEMSARAGGAGAIVRVAVATATATKPASDPRRISRPLMGDPRASQWGGASVQTCNFLAKRALQRGFDPCVRRPRVHVVTAQHDGRVNAVRV